MASQDKHKNEHFFHTIEGKKHHRQRQEQNQMKPLGLKIENSYEKGFNIDFS